MKRSDLSAPFSQHAATASPLRAKALQWLHEQPARPSLEPSSKLDDLELDRILEELRIYQAELEVQNEELRSAQSRTDQLLQRFSLLFRQAPVAMLLVDRFGVIKDASSAALSLFRLSGHHARHHLLSRLVAESSRHMIESAFVRAEGVAGLTSAIVLNGVEMIDGAGALRTGDFSVLRLPVSDHEEELEFVCVYADHTELSQMASDLQKHNDHLRLYAQAFEQVSDAIMVTDLHGHIQSINSAFTRITGYTEDQVIGQSTRMLGSGHTPREVFEQMWSCLLEAGRWEGEISNRRSDGVVYPEWLSIETLHDQAGHPWRYVAIFHDLTQVRAHEETLRQLAQEDALTGLPNRHIMKTLVGQAFERARRSESKVAMLFVDLDNFKTINDSLGHLVGDETLIQFARRLRVRLRDTDTLVRMGGDEFLIVAEHLHSAADASQLAQSLLDTMTAPLELEDGRQMFVTCSIGIGLFPDDGENPEQLLQEADAAMYRAKSTGRNRFEFFSPALIDRVQEEFSVSTDLRLALQRSELFLEFQPLIPTHPDQPFEVEALVRWRHPVKQVLYPGSFVDIAERSGLIHELSLYVLRESCRAMRRLLDASVPISAIAVNVSFRDLESMPLAQYVRDILADNGLRGDQLKLELTESDIMRNVDQTLATLEQIRALGVRIAVDDFGTGFSSLAYLRMLPLDTLKIDASFVAAMENEANAKSIVETIVSLGKVLNLKLVAEGVETFVETELLRQLNVDYLQGWYFSRSVKENALAQTLARLQSPGPTASTDPSQC